MKPVISQVDTLREHGGTVLEGHYLCHGQPIACPDQRAYRRAPVR
jgi:hypothetical protein